MLNCITQVFSTRHVEIKPEDALVRFREITVDLNTVNEMWRRFTKDLNHRRKILEQKNCLSQNSLNGSENMYQSPRKCVLSSEPLDFHTSRTENSLLLRNPPAETQERERSIHFSKYCHLFAGQIDSTNSIDCFITYFEQLNYLSVKFFNRVDIVALYT